MFSEYIRTFLEQLSIFDCDSLKTLVAVRACLKERNANCKKNEDQNFVSLIFLRNLAYISWIRRLRDYDKLEENIFIF